MNQRVKQSVATVAAPHRHFTRDQWADLRADTPLTLTIEDLRKLQSTNDPISLDEVIAIYLPLSRLLALYVAATQGLFKATQRFLGAEDEGKMPYIIGVAGSVAVGKSTTSRVMQALLSRWPNTPKVELVTTDGFLLPNKVLLEREIMDRKGFPESFDGASLLHFLSDVKAGMRNVRAPIYSHLTYDVVPGEYVTVDRPDILIVEGLNVLAPNRPSKDGCGHALRVGLLRFFRLPPRRPGSAGKMVRGALHAAARDRLPRPAFLFHQICRDQRRRGGGDRAGHLDPHQPQEPARQRAADARAREPDPHQGREPPDRRSRITQIVTTRHAMVADRNSAGASRSGVPDSPCHASSAFRPGRPTVSHDIADTATAWTPGDVVLMAEVAAGGDLRPPPPPEDRLPVLGHAPFRGPSCATRGIAVDYVEFD